jgi:branched-chain amino acid aminotransferase
VFTACRTVREKIFRVDDHLDRVYRSAGSVRMMPPMDRAELRRLLFEVVAKNREEGFTGDLLLDIVFSGGLEGQTMKQSGRGAFLYVPVQPLEAWPQRLYEEGMALATFPHQRILPDVKLLNYVGAILGHQTVVPQHEADEVLFVDPVDTNTVLEGSTYTAFFVDSAGEIVTPPLDGRILDSITRRVVLEILAARSEFSFHETSVFLDRLDSFTEAFIVSTTRNIMPVTRIDRTRIGTGKPGPVTGALMRLFDDYLASY